MIFVIITLVILIGILFTLLVKKKTINNKELEEYNQKLEAAREEYNKINQNYKLQAERTRDAEERYNAVIQQYKNTTSKNQEDLDKFF